MRYRHLLEQYPVIDAGLVGKPGREKQRQAVEVLQRIDRDKKKCRAERVFVSIMLFVTWGPAAMTRSSNVTVYGGVRYCPAGRGRPINQS